MYDCLPSRISIVKRHSPPSPVHYSLCLTAVCRPQQHDCAAYMHWTVQLPLICEDLPPAELTDSDISAVQYETRFRTCSVFWSQSQTVFHECHCLYDFTFSSIKTLQYSTEVLCMLLNDDADDDSVRVFEFYFVRWLFCTAVVHCRCLLFRMMAWTPDVYWQLKDSWKKTELIATMVL